MSELDREFGVIVSGKTCPVCGYALAGLKRGGQCPECGAPIAPSARADDAMSSMPESVIRAYRFGGIFATIAACGMLPAIALASGGYRILAPMLFVACSVVWFVGVCWLTTSFDTPASAGYGFSSRGKLRVAARWAQLAGVGYAAMLLTRAASPGAPASVDQMLGLAASALGLATVVAIVLISVVLRRLAEWTRDDLAASAFNLAAFGYPVLVVMLNLSGWFFGSFVARLAIGAVALATLFCLPVGMLSLTRSLDYAIAHSQDAEVREERRTERQERHDRRMRRRLKDVETPRRVADGKERPR